MLCAARGWRLGRWVPLVALPVAACTPSFDVCEPVEGRVGFFSQGDCVLTRAGFFQGHEWLTYLGNEDLPDGDRFSETDVQAIADGNRRVDWPQELLVHLNNSVVAYASALVAHTDKPEHQRQHFLLTDTNSTHDAIRQANGRIRRLANEAGRQWFDSRIRSLTLIGQAQHTLQDGFSAAHTLREPEHPTRPWCIRQVKAYIPRAHGRELDGDRPVLFHGGDDGDTIGHATSEDSIYRPGRDCREPAGREHVEDCLNLYAQRGRQASSDHLALMLRAIRSGLRGEDLDREVDALMDLYVEEHFSACPDS